MFEIVEGKTCGLKDAENFLELINDPPDDLRGFFDESADIFVARAPGRLDVMGGIADYSGSLVMPMPIAEATFAAVQRRMDDIVAIVSRLPDGNLRRFQMNTSAFDLASGSYDIIESLFPKKDRWAAYIAGAFFVLRNELGQAFENGVRILVNSNIPIGKGVSSSAAVEVSTMHAICAAFDIKIEPRRSAILCQVVENTIVGAACGVMDQIAVHCGVENSLVSLKCQPASIGEPVKIPIGMELWGIDSGVRHAVAGSDYSSVRVGAFMGYRIVAGLEGLPFEKTGEAMVRIEDDRWNGYLSNVTPKEFEDDFADRLPVSISGREFLEKYVGTTDSVAPIDPERIYAVRAPTEHGIYENDRVNDFAELIKKPIEDSILDGMGELMFASHAGYASCGLNESGTDLIVEMVRKRRSEGVFGARITGGGSGGTVVVLTRTGSRRAIETIAADYATETGRAPYIFHGSSPGCSAFGHLRLRYFAG